MINKFSEVFKRIMIAVAIMLSCKTSFGQNLDNIQIAFNSNYKNVLQEKLFLHSDKAFYLTGEILWFKIYNVEATLHIPINISKVAYAEVLDKNNVPVLQAKIALNEGTGSGSLYLPVNMASGNYKLRAYTNWMKNFSPDSYFEKNITVINPLVSPDPESVKNGSYDIQFFAEGGNMLGGVAGKVAFRVVDQNGKGINFSGAIVDIHNDTVARFKPLKFGIGSFVFSPVTGNTYKAIIKTADGKSIVQNLPAVAQQGYSIQLSNTGTSQISVTVHSSDASGMVYLFTHSGSLVLDGKAQAANLNGGTAIFTIDKSKLADGISHLTLFNANKQPVCERLYFKRPVQRLFINASTDQKEYTPRKNVTVNIAAKDDSGKPQLADLSLSVYKFDPLQTADQSNIVNYLWLTSDIKGTVESPGYYFDNNTPEADEAMDNLMLSQGWSRFVWNDVVKNNPSSYKYLPEASGILVAGKLTDNKTGAPAYGVPAFMSIVGKRVQLYTSKSDSLGGVLFNTRDLYGTGEAVFTTNTLVDTTYRIDIQSPFSEKFSGRKHAGFQFNKTMAPVLLAHSTGMQVQNIYYNAAIKQFYTPQIDTLSFYGKPDKAYKLDDYTRFATMEEVLREYIREVGVSHQQKKFHVSILTYDKGYLDNNPLVLYDDVPIFDMDKLMSIDPLKVNKLEAVAQRYYLGPVAEDGILNLQSYKGDLASFEIDPHAVVLDFEGMQFKRQFFSPVYQTDEQVESRKPDLRNLLYWSPEVYTDAKGNKSLNFYTSDEKGTYIGVIQGITNGGSAAVNTFSFVVK